MSIWFPGLWRSHPSSPSAACGTFCTKKEGPRCTCGVIVVVTSGTTKYWTQWDTWVLLCRQQAQRPCCLVKGT
eukprot:12737229-Prorocentrum_lima.AAC.1